MDKKKSLKNWKSKNRAFNRNAKIDRREYELKNMSPARREMIKKSLDCEKTDLQSIRDKIFPSHMQKENKEIQKELNMAKNIIRLTESDLHRIVKESVKRVLREVSREMPLRNKFGEPLDTGGFYYPEDYENTDSWVDDSYRKYNKLIADINDGMYDDQMDRIWELDPVDYFNLDIDSGTNWKQVVYAVKQRKKFLDGVTR